MKKTKDFTPIEDARNLGPVLTAEFSTFGVNSLEQIKDMGWEEFCMLYVEHYPERLHLIVFYAIIGATVNQKLKDLDVDLKFEAKALAKRLRQQRRLGQ